MLISRISIKLLNRFYPQFMWRLYANRSQFLSDKPLFILSFDCDTEEDAAVALDVHAKLQDMGITPVYAVPGALLKKGEKIYRKIFESGAEFINHGGREHTYFDTTHNRHASNFFYDQQTNEVLREDIVAGHNILQSVLGVMAKGWRTPHFGTFQHPRQLDFLYEILNDLKYQFSTSTIPSMGYLHGPLHKRNSIIEIPVTGIFSEPLNILDTWAYFGAPVRQKTAQDYMIEVKKLAGFSKDHPILINIYGDPSHIYDKSEFFQAMKYFSQVAKNVNYLQLLEIAGENIRSI